MSFVGKEVIATATTTFTGEAVNHLSLNVGDLVTVTNQSGDFWEGKCKGRVGIFPASCVTINNKPTIPNLPPPPQRKNNRLSHSMGTASSITPKIASAGSPQATRAPSPAMGRPLPKFSDVAVDDDQEPIAPPRSPPVSPRAHELPPLPPRPSGAVEQIVIKSAVEIAQPVAVPSPQLGKKTQADLRKDCLNEIFQTEKDYIEDLETLINVFIFPLRTMQIQDNILYNIFSNVEVLINCNKEMLKELEDKMAASKCGDEVLIGEVFTKLADYFKMYKVYCANQQTSLTTVDYQTRKSPQFKKCMETCQTDPRCKGLSLQSFLIKPIQRVCKYPLLLRELIRHTPESHQDFEALQSAFTKINVVVTNINEGQREAENLQRVLELQNKIEGVDTLVSPGRRLTKEGDLLFYKNQKSKHGERRHVFFFSDLILITSKKGERRFEAKLQIPLDNCKIIVVGDSNYIKNAFELSNATTKVQCILSSETSDETNQWVKEIKYLIKEVYQKKALELTKKGLAPGDVN